MVEITKRRSIFIAFSVGGAYLGWGLILSIQPSFYPTVAEEKGATPAQYGFVFGIINLAALIFAPLCAQYGTKIGPKLMYNTGAFVQGAVAFAFGFLIYAEKTNVFIGLSYALRFVEGIAEAMAWGAIISILMKVYPNQVTTVMSFTEMCFGAGYMLGPAIGSALFVAGGFMVPFLVVGSGLLIIAVCIFFAIPSVKPDDPEETNDANDGKKALSLWSLVKSPSILVPYLDNFVCLAGAGMIESMLDPYAKNVAGASQTDVGNIFLCLGAMYMVNTPITGYICDKIKYPCIPSIAGNFIMAIAMLFYGPVPFIRSVSPSVGLMQGMAAMTGIGNALVMVSTFGRAQRAAIRKGFKDDLETYLVCSSMWSGSFFAGNFVGPTAAGVIVEAIGFPNTTVIFFVLFICAFAMDIGELIYQRVMWKRMEGYDQLE